MPKIPLIAAKQCGVFSWYQAARAGWTSSAVRHAVGRGRIERLRNGAYQVVDLSEVDADLSDYERARWLHAGPAVAGALTVPGALASHSTAAVLHRVALLFVPEQPCLSVVWDPLESTCRHASLSIL